jgi:hypothetical protein
VRDNHPEAWLNGHAWDQDVGYDIAGQKASTADDLITAHEMNVILLSGLIEASWHSSSNSRRRSPSMAIVSLEDFEGTAVGQSPVGPELIENRYETDTVFAAPAGTRDRLAVQSRDRDRVSERHRSLAPQASSLDLRSSPLPQATRTAPPDGQP